MWQPQLIMQNGRLLPFADARVHPLSLAVAYATTVFEGIRAYHNPADGSFSLFRLPEHFRRLQVGMKLLHMQQPFDLAQLTDHLRQLIRANHPDDDVYVRLLVYVEAMGLMATLGPVGFTAAAMPREKSKFVDTGMALCVSSWTRLADNASPPRIKSTANYHNARITQLQAKADGYDAGLMLTPSGKVSETPIACFFMVRDGRLITPSLTSNVLESVTRDTIITLYRETTGREVEQREVDRSELYYADEAFICGTGQEIIPVGSIDRYPVGDGKVGPVTTALKQRYFEVVRGMGGDHAEWRIKL